jgi:hypothetical protein
MLEELSHINFDSFQDEGIKSTLRVLLNLIESQQKKILEQSETIQQLKDEINILKGEQGKPTFKPKKPSKDISSESHLNKINKKVKWEKKGKKKGLPIDKREECKIDKSLLPKDAVFKKYETRVQQDMVFKRVNTEFQIEVWYSPSKNKTYRSRPEGYFGYFGNELKTFVLMMHNFADITQSKLLELLRGMDIEISTGSLQNILSSNKDTWIKEKQEIVKSGLQGSFTQTDTTGAKVAGELWHTHVLCSNNFMSFSTLEGKSRRHLLYALQGEPEEGLSFVYNETTKKYLGHFGISKTHKEQLENIYKSQEVLTELEFRKKTAESIPDLVSKKTTFNWVCDAFAFGYYHKQKDYRQVNILVSDNAPEYNLIAGAQGLCWVHDARNYNKLAPFIAYHKGLVEKFQEEYWAFYRTLLDYKENPNQALKQGIITGFDQLFVSNTNYFDLNKQINKTRKNKDKLLTVLENPQIPLHNNLSELAARYQVRKRDICLHTMTRMGTKLQDAFMSIIHTCKMNRVNPYSYIKERLAGTNEIYLPDLVLANIDSS